MLECDGCYEDLYALLPEDGNTTARSDHAALHRAPAAKSFAVGRNTGGMWKCAKCLYSAVCQRLPVLCCSPALTAV